MKKKSFKKMLAGVSAVAMLASAMPMSLIADAYSYNNVPATDFSTLAGSLSTDNTNIDVSTGQTAVTVANFNLKGYTYKVEKYEIPNVTEAGTGNPNAWNTEQAVQDIIDNVKDVTAVTFKADGTIDTITMNMPVTNDTIVNTAHNVAYQEIEFKVVRTKADMEAIFATTGGKEVGAILADDITSTSAITNEVQLQYMKLNLNLNGKSLTVNKGIKVTNQRLRIWGAGTSTIANDSGEDVPVLNTTGSAGRIEIYDNVKINATKSSSSTKPVISCEEGKILIAGDKVNVVHDDSTTGKAVVGDGLVTGDYDYYEEVALTTQITDLSTLKDQDEFATSKKHTFNSKGIEVTARGTADVEKAAYYDADLKTDGLQYAYQPADNVNNTTDSVSNGRLTDDANTNTIGISNAGQLYWLSEQVEGRTNNLNVNITANLDFAGMPEKFTPIDASGYQLQIKGADVAAGTNSMGRVISNIDILSATADAVTGQENAGLISKTKAGATNKIESIGIENAKVATTSKTDSYAGVFAGEANGLELLNVYTLNPTFTNAQFVGSAAAKFQNSSKMTYSYFAAKYPVFDAVDNSTIAILDTTIAGTVTNGKSVYYDSTLYTKANATQKKLSAATSADFKKGAVAFALNKHDATYADAANDPTAWDNGTNAGTSAGDASVNTPVAGSGHAAPWNGTYETDVFGQTLDGAKYPTFLQLDPKVTAPNTNRIATNRVFRQISTDCSGIPVRWTATNAQFGNEEIDISGGHEDANNDHRCDECGAYEISYWFDDTLAPFLSAKTTEDYGVAPSIDGKYVSLSKIGTMTSVTFDLRKTGKTADQIVDAINKVNAKGETGIKGFDLLNKGYTSGKELSGTMLISNIQIIVDDEVICKTYGANAVASSSDADDITEVGYKVANAAVSTAYEPVVKESVTSTTIKVAPQAPKLTSIDIADNSITAVTNAAAATKYDFYVAADKQDVDADNGGDKSVNFATFKSHKAGFTPNALNDYTFVIQFAGVKHNDKYDHDTDAADLGGWNVSTNGTYTTATGSIMLKKADGSGYGAKDASANGISAAGDADTSVHAFVGTGCGCVIEEAHENEFAITNKGHQGKCAVCALVLGKKEFDGTAVDVKKGEFEPHTYETVFTTGNLTLKRCTVCGYTTFTKDANITISTPEIEKLEDSDAAFRQKYAFDIAAGDTTIVQYGVIYSKEGKTIDSTKIDALNDSNKYFKANGTINTTVLGDLKYTKKNAIKTGGTYNVNISVESENTDVTLCGYVIYQNADKTYGIVTTDIVTNNFKALAVAEIENNCAINYEGALDGVNASGVAVWKNTYFSDVDSAFTIKEVGALVSKKAATPVTNKTLTTDADGTNIKKGTKTPTRSTTKAFTYSANIKKSDADLATTTMRGYLTVEYKGITHTLYTDVNNATNS